MSRKRPDTTSLRVPLSKENSLGGRTTSGAGSAGSATSRYVSSLGSVEGQRLTQSWHSGRQEGPTLTWPVSRSFANGCTQEYENCRAFGAIERRPKLTLPTDEERGFLRSFSDRYEAIHNQKPHVVAFVNSRSGGQTGQLLMRALSESIGKHENPFTGEVCDLSLDHEPASTIERLGNGFEYHAQRRLLICGGDGTVTWILTALAECRSLQGKHHLLPAAIVPLGTGNDLARSLGWGKSLRAVSDVLEYLQLVTEATPVTLDQWRLVLRPHEQLPDTHKLRKPGSHPQIVDDRETARALNAYLDEALAVEAPAPAGGAAVPADIYVGFWQNYFSLGMDAKVAWYVDNARSRSTGRAFFRWGLGKVCYAWQGLRHSCCTRRMTPELQRLRVAEAVDDDDGDAASTRTFYPPLAERPIQGRAGRLRQMVMININSYAAGLNVLPPADRAARRPSPSDGVLEVLGVRNPFTQLLHFLRLVKPQYLASARQVVFRHTSGEWMQLDGEPWLLDSGCDVLIEPHRQLTMLCAPASGPFWRGHLDPSYWEPASPMEAAAAAGPELPGPGP